METDVMIRALKYTANKHKNDRLVTFDTNITAMCNDVIPKLELLKAYENIGPTPEQLLEIDKMYTEKCREVAELKAYKDTGIPLEDNTKLKPCPFCGSHDVDVVIYSDDGTLEPAGEDEAPAFVRCWGCDMDYFPNTDIQGKVMEAWNRRLKDE